MRCARWQWLRDEVTAYECAAVCCSVLQCVSVRCGVLRCNVSQRQKDLAGTLALTIPKYLAPKQTEYIFLVRL